jgi:hypothetical protein
MVFWLIFALCLIMTIFHDGTMINICSPLHLGLIYTLHQDLDHIHDHDVHDVVHNVKAHRGQTIANTN